MAPWWYRVQLRMVLHIVCPTLASKSPYSKLIHQFYGASCLIFLVSSYLLSVVSTSHSPPSSNILISSAGLKVENRDKNWVICQLLIKS